MKTKTPTIEEPNICKHLMHDEHGQYIGALQFVTPAEAERLKSERDQALNALRLLNAHLNDMRKSNPGYLGKLVLQDYGLMNEAFLATSAALKTGSGQ